MTNRSAVAGPTPRSRRLRGIGQALADDARVEAALLGGRRVARWTRRTALPLLALLALRVCERLAAHLRSAAVHGAALVRDGWRRAELDTEVPLYAAAVVAAGAVGWIVAHSA